MGSDAAAGQDVNLLTDEDETVFTASTLKAATAASIIMNIRVSWSQGCKKPGSGSDGFLGFIRFWDFSLNQFL